MRPLRLSQHRHCIAPGVAEVATGTTLLVPGNRIAAKVKGMPASQFCLARQNRGRRWPGNDQEAACFLIELGVAPVHLRIARDRTDWPENPSRTETSSRLAS